MNKRIIYSITILQFIFLAHSCKKEAEEIQGGGGGTTETLSAPTLSIPSNGSQNLWPPITFSWSAVSGATSYEIEAKYYGNTGQLNGLLFSKTSSTNSYSHTQGMHSSFNDETIYWKVRAKNSSGVSDWSAMWSFNLHN